MKHDPVGLGQGAAPLQGCPFLNVEELLSELAERAKRLATWERIRAAISPLRPKESAEVQLGIPLIPRAFVKDFAEIGLGKYLIQTETGGKIKIKRL